nr:hypothetical protein [uncultured bacterium]
MLRVLSTVSLLLMVVFTGVGLAFSKAWGWSEYASDALYLIYAYPQADIFYPAYSIINTDGRGRPEKLIWKDEPIARIGCSPDGRTFAFLTAGRHLYVLTREGLSYDKLMDQPYDALDVMNDQRVGLYLKALEAPYGTTVNPNKTVSAEPRPLYQWLASEKIFMSTSASDRPYITDVQTGVSAWIHYSLRFAPRLSPDGTKTALSRASLDSQGHLYMVDFKSHQPMFQLPDNAERYSSPLCFLTFRPEMLVGGS